MGKIAAEQLLGVLRGHGPGQLVQVPFSLQIRGSTAAVP
jgi:LacI family transcriptional regulator